MESFDFQLEFLQFGLQVDHVFLFQVDFSELNFHRVNLHFGLSDFVIQLPLTLSELLYLLLGLVCLCYFLLNYRTRFKFFNFW